MVLLEQVLNPKPVEDNFDPTGSTYTWFCESDKEFTYIYANWSKGWIIENNVIRNSKCSGITVGKYGDKWDNTSENAAVGYVKTIERALENGWSKQNIGSHIILNNSISECGQTGICGSMGGVFSTIENNDIFNIWTKRQWTGHEMGGIKIHASIDMIIKNNRLANCGRGLWLDWMTQGTRVSGNLFYNNTTDDLYVEVNHGPFLIENNILLSELSINDASEGGAYVHNLIAGNIISRPRGRKTPFQIPHSTEVGGLKTTKGGDNRYFNNIFIGGVKETQSKKSGMGVYKETEFPMYVDGNVYLNRANDFENEANNLKLNYDPCIQIDENEDGIFLSINFNKSILKMKPQIVTTELLGKAIIPNQGYVSPDGSDIIIDADYFGNSRNRRNPTAGPFEKPGIGYIKLKVW